MSEEYKDRLFATKLSALGRNDALEKLLKEHYGNASLEVHYVKCQQYDGYLGRVAILFETPEDHTAFVLAHGHKYS